MAYTFRFNAEAAFFRAAEEHYRGAQAGFVEVRHVNSDGEDASVVGPGSAESLMHAAIAVVCWAISVESYANLCWDAVAAPRLPTDGIRRKLVRSLSTTEKLAELSTMTGRSVTSESWWSGLKQLIEARNFLAHYKEGLDQHGFERAPEIMRRFSVSRLQAMRTGAMEAVRWIHQADPALLVPPSFIDGVYEIIVVEE